MTQFLSFGSQVWQLYLHLGCRGCPSPEEVVLSQFADILCNSAHIYK